MKKKTNICFRSHARSFDDNDIFCLVSKLHDDLIAKVFSMTFASKVTNSDFRNQNKTNIAMNIMAKLLEIK